MRRNSFGRCASCLRKNAKCHAGSANGAFADEVAGGAAAGAVLVEYYSAGDRMVAAIISREGIEIVPVSVVSRITICCTCCVSIRQIRMGAAYTTSSPAASARHAGHLEDCTAS